MNRGRIQLAAICLCAIALSISGCGDDAPSKSTADAADATAETSAATGATGAAKKKAAKAKAKEKREAKKAAAQDSKRVTAYNNPTVETVAPDELVPPPAQKDAVREAFDANIDALRDGDAERLCNEIYSPEYKALLDDKGGCIATVEKQVGGITDYSAKVTAISRFPNSNLIAVYANFKFTNQRGTHNSKGGLYFKTVDGEWKRAIPPKA